MLLTIHARLEASRIFRPRSIRARTGIQPRVSDEQTQAGSQAGAAGLAARLNRSVAVAAGNMTDRLISFREVAGLRRGEGQESDVGEEAGVSQEPWYGRKRRRGQHRCV